jgi:WD40 repeat protein
LIHFWNAEDGASLGSLPSRSEAISALAFVTTNVLVRGTFGRSFAVLDTDSRWELAARFGTGDEQSPIRDRVNALSFSPDGRWLASGGGEPTRSGEILIWDVASGQLRHSLTNVHSDAVFALDFSPDAHFLASGASDKFARIVDLESLKVVRHLEGHTHHVLGVSWKLDGRTLATAGADNVVKLWNVPTGERRRNVTGYDKEITAIQFLYGADNFLTGSGDARVRLLKEDGSEVRSFASAPGFVQSAAASLDGTVVIAGGDDGLLRVWNGTNGEVKATFSP